MIDFIASIQQGAFDAIASEDILHALEDLISSLSEKEALVLRMRFGIENGESQTLQAIGETLGGSRERVRQVQTKALRKLRVSEGVRSFRGVASSLKRSQNFHWVRDRLKSLTSDHFCCCMDGA